MKFWKDLNWLQLKPGIDEGIPNFESVRCKVKEIYPSLNLDPRLNEHKTVDIAAS